RSWSFFLSHPYPSSIRWGPKPVISSATSAQPARCAPVPETDSHDSLSFLFLVDLVQLLIVAVVGLLEVVFEFLFVLEFLVFVEFVVLEELVVLFAVAVLLNFVVRRGLELVVAGKSLLPLHGRLGWISWRFAPFMLPGLLMYRRTHRCAAT